MSLAPAERVTPVAPVDRAGPPARPGFAQVVAQLTLIAAPLLAFRVFPTSGIATLALVVPLLVLVAAYVRTPGLPVPVREFLFLAIILGSVTWSEIPAYTTERLRTYGVLIIATLFAATLLRPSVVLRCLKISFGIIVAASLLTLARNPETLLRRQGSDLIAIHAQFEKNTFGGLLVFAMLLALGRWSRTRALIVPALAVLIYFNHSVTAYIVGLAVFLAAVFTGLLFRFVPGRSARPLLLASAVTGVGVLALIGPLVKDQVLLVVGKNQTLGSRTEIWAACWRQIVKQPLDGYGAFTFVTQPSGSTSSLSVASEFTNYVPPHPHNGALDVLGQLGVIGLVAFLVMVIGALLTGARAAMRGDETARVALLGLSFVLLFGLTEPTYLGDWLVVTLCCCVMARGEPAGDPEADRAEALGITTPGVATEPVRPGLL